MPDLIQLSRRSFVVMPLALMACKPGDPVIRISGLTMGTTYNVVAIDRTGELTQTHVETAVTQALNSVNVQMSNWDPASDISRFNAQQTGDAVPITSDLAEVMAAAQKVHEASEGRFDTTMGPLIELWGFGANGTTNVPSVEEVGAAMARTGHSNTLSQDHDGLRKVQRDTQVYLAAIGKGFGADKVGRALEALGTKDYMIEIGGDLYASGSNPDGQPWQIGVETPDPANRTVMDVIGVSGMGLASSGDYRNYFEVDGQRYSHVIDPTTGHPVTHKTASATVLADNAMLADAWATAMLILGREKGLEIAAAQNLAVLFVERDAQSKDLRFVTAASDQFKAITS